MFNFREWENKDVVMHCKTEKEAKAFCKEMDDAKKLWSSNESYVYNNGKINTNWSQYEEKTCYNFNYGYYDDLDFYKNLGYIILEYSDYMDKDNATILSKKEINLCELLEKGYISRFLDNSLVWSEESPKIGSDLYIVKGGALDINEFRNELNINVEDLNFDFIKKGEIYKVEDLLN